MNLTICIQTKLAEDKPRMTRTFDNRPAAEAYAVRWVKRNFTEKDPQDIASRAQTAGICYFSGAWIKWTERALQEKSQMTREQAMEAFRILTRQYGLRWTASVPASAYDKMMEINTVLTEHDRREALGLPPIRR